MGQHMEAKGIIPAVHESKEYDAWYSGVSGVDRIAATQLQFAVTLTQNIHKTQSARRFFLEPAG